MTYRAKKRIKSLAQVVDLNCHQTKPSHSANVQDKNKNDPPKNLAPQFIP